MIRSKQFEQLGILIATVAVLVIALPATAATCNVPSAPHPTIQAAVDDVACTQIVVAAGTYTGRVAIARSVNLPGRGATRPSSRVRSRSAQGR